MNLTRTPVTGAIGCSFIVTEVTTAKVPPPPLRNAQKWSGWEHSLAVTCSPLARTALHCRTLSTTNPYAGDSAEWPRACTHPPAGQTVRDVPPTTVYPAAATSLHSCSQRVPHCSLSRVSFCVPQQSVLKSAECP